MVFTINVKPLNEGFMIKPIFQTKKIRLAYFTLKNKISDFSFEWHNETVSKIVGATFRVQITVLGFGLMFRIKP